MNFAGFYEKWYTPNRMAVVVVGDFEDPGECEVLGPTRNFTLTHKDSNHIINNLHNRPIPYNPKPTGKVVECIKTHMAAVGPRPRLTGEPPAAAAVAGTAAAVLGSAGAAAAAEGGVGASGEHTHCAGCAAAACGGACGAAEAVPWSPHTQPRCKAFVDRWVLWRC